MGDIGHLFAAQLGVAQARNGIVLVQTLLCLGGRFDVPGDDRLVEGAGDLVGEERLARTRFALDQERPLQVDGGIDGHL